MTYIEAVILGVVQGLTEFLPISSSGHLVLFERYLGITGGGMLTFAVAVHVATLVAVFVVFWKDIYAIIRNPFARLPLLLIVGTIPAVIFGFSAKDFIEKTFESGSTLGFEFIATGIILFIADRMKGRDKELGKMSWLDAIIIGVAQAFAILPAVSRSGFTIAGGLFAGLNREAALRFSFLLSIPAILGGAVFDLKDLLDTPAELSSLAVGPLVAGMIAAGIVGYFSIRFMMQVFKTRRFTFFTWYVMLLGVAVLIDQYLI